MYTQYNQIQTKTYSAKDVGSCRFVYNQMIDVQQECYKDNKSHLSEFDANAYTNVILKKAEYPFLKG